MSGLYPVSRRSGVIDSVTKSVVSAESPVTFWIVSTGSGPRPPVRAARTSQRNGSADASRSTGRITRVIHCVAVT